MLGLNTGQKIQEEAQDIEGERERHNPLEDGGDVVQTAEIGDSKHYRERDFDQDKGQFRPEGDAQDAVVAIVDPQALILGAEEDCTDDVASNEEKQEAVVQVRMVVRVKDAQQDQAGSACDAGSDAATGEDFLRGVGVARETACVP